MSDRMTCIPFSQLLNWVFDEYQSQGTVFGVHQPYKAKEGKTLELFGRKLETPIGPAAGPHTQLAQNIISAYFAGTKLPICAIKQIIAVCLKIADLPAILGPVTMMICCESLSRKRSLGMYFSPSGSAFSIIGWRASFKLISKESVRIGLV